MKNHLIAALFLLVLMIGCKKDDDKVNNPPPIINEQEIITTMTLHFVDSSNSANSYSATFRDPDGDGGASYDIFDSIKLEANKTWFTTLILLNETASPVDTISNDVLDEAVDHLVCFTPSGTSAMVTITDLDGNGLPLGLQSKWKTGSAGTGTMQIILRHQPGTKDGTCTPGESDIDVTFPVIVQ
ncbi:MAG: hypothetical protein ACYC1Q_11430 [Bacteroidia bacterium]